MQALKHKTSTSFEWLHDGFQLLRKKPVTLVSIFLMAGVLKAFILMIASAILTIFASVNMPEMLLVATSSVLTAIPGVFVFVYVFYGLSMAEKDNAPNVLNLFTVFTQPVSLKLLKIGLFFACVEVVLSLLFYSFINVDDPTLMFEKLRSQEGGPPASTVLTWCLFLYLKGLSSFVFGFAGFIAVSSQISAGQAMFYSFYGTLMRNFLPFTMLQVLLAAVMFVSAVMAYILLLMFQFMPVLGFLILIALTIGFTMVALAAGYYFYKRTFLTSDTEKQTAKAGD